MPPLEDHFRRELVTAFSTHRPELAEALFQAVKDPECSAGDLPDRLAELHDWGQALYLAAIRLATQWLKTPEELSESLFLGLVSQLSYPAARRNGMAPFLPGKALEFAKLRWLAMLETKVSAQACETLGTNLDRIIEPLALPVRKRLRVLYIGDCLALEIMAVVANPCARAQIGIESTHIHNAVTALIRNEIRGLEPDAFDLVFFSPFSYTAAPEYGQLLRWNAALWPRAKFFSLLDQMLEDAALTVRTLAAQLGCPIYVHNCAGILQSFDLLRGVAKNAVSLRNRVAMRPFIRQRVNRLVSDPSFEARVRLIDEESLRQGTSDSLLGKVLFQDQVFHPTRFSIGLAQGPYMAAIASTAFLATKKVVVCDLDNTLWDGIVGEGAVVHFSDRQKILKELRNRGILLSINSKNDPAKINFSGAVLQMDDFVAPRINWQSKVPNMASIVEELNLKEKDFVFIDDRPDELERVRNAFPAMTTLDATDAKTWSWLSHWDAHMPAGMQEDRTRLYHERAAREQFLSHSGGRNVAEEDEVAALTRLELWVKIEHATRSSDLKRAVELVNRTNQFNLCGSRVTVAELEKGLGENQWVITAAAKDKFGSMGVVGVMLVRRKPEGLEVPVFVLSCRVFGFGIEYALLRGVSELAPADCRLAGLYTETPHNQPCRDFYAKAGLKLEGTEWIGAIAALTASPSWLTIEGLPRGRF